VTCPFLSAADTLNEGPRPRALPVGVHGGDRLLRRRRLRVRVPRPPAVELSRTAAGRAAWIVLAISFVAEGVSWLQSLRQARRQAAEYRRPLWRYLRRASDPVVRAVVFEDSAALAGLLLAGTGLFLSERLGSSLPDALASLAIGLLLAVTAFGLARPLADFLVGRSLPPEQLEKLHSLLASTPGVARVVTLHALYSGPEEVLVVAKVLPAGDVGSKDLARAMDEAEEKIRAELPVVADVYVDMTRSRPDTSAGSSSTRRARSSPERRVGV
jgi:divalent metal cation (Fe/Co/Zn/Cd) transporter